MAYLWQISIVHFKEKSIISGTILSGDVKQKKWTLRLPFVYFQKPLANHPIQIQVGRQEFNISTDQYGSFLLECNFIASHEVRIFSDKKQLKINQSYPFVFQRSDYPIMVISDVDDTLLVSYTASTWNRIWTILFTSPENRKSVGFTREILKAVSNMRGRIFYVSKSESNLFILLTSVIQKQNLPAGKLILTPFLRYTQLLHPKKGKDYKLKAIQKIIINSPNKMFILMGDDTQQDISVYTSIVKQYPDKIFKVYIRRTRKQLLGQKKKQLENLKNSVVSFFYFSDQDPVKQEIEIIEKKNNEITFRS